MDIRTAILKAADHIERNPGSFDYSNSDIPDCGTPGCAIGWIAFHRGIRGAFCATNEADAIRAVGIPWGYAKSGPTFVRRMDDFSDHWRRSAKECAKALRGYADKYHPAAPIQYPNWNAIATAQTAAPAGAGGGE